MTSANDRCHLTADAHPGYHGEWESSNILLFGRHEPCGIAIDASAEPPHLSGAIFSSAVARVRRFVLF